MAERPSDEGWHSYLDEHPQYVQAIGMISIENANLEMALANLLAAILNLRSDVGTAIFFAARSANLRLDILEAAAGSRFRPKKEDDRFFENEIAKAAALRDVSGIIKRARSAVGRRHAVIHDAWGIEDTTGQVQRASLPVQGVGTPEPISTLNNLIRDIRKSIGEADALTASMWGHHPTLVDMQIGQPDKNRK